MQAIGHGRRFARTASAVAAGGADGEDQAAIERLAGCPRYRRPGAVPRRDKAFATCIDQFEANRNRMRCDRCRTRIADRIRQRGKRLQTARREPVQAGGVPLVENGCRRSVRRRMLYRNNRRADFLDSRACCIAAA